MSCQTKTSQTNKKIEYAYSYSFFFFCQKKQKSRSISSCVFFFFLHSSTSTVHSLWRWRKESCDFNRIFFLLKVSHLRTCKCRGWNNLIYYLVGVLRRHICFPKCHHVMVWENPSRKCRRGETRSKHWERHKICRVSFYFQAFLPTKKMYKSIPLGESERWSDVKEEKVTWVEITKAAQY